MKRKVWNVMSVLLLSLILILPAHAAQVDNVIDEAGILTQEERQDLNDRAQEITEQYDFGVYIITVDDYQGFTGSYDIHTSTEKLYEWNDLGVGDNRDGILLMLSMAERDYSLLAYGDYAKYAFNDEGRPLMTEFFLDDFGYDAWYDGFSEYLTWSADYLEAAKNGQPYSDSNRPTTDGDAAFYSLIVLAVLLLLPLVIAGIVVLVLTAQLESVAKATKASHYVSGNLQLTQQWDQFTHTTQTRRKIEKKSSSSNRSSGRSSSTSGKF